MRKAIILYSTTDGHTIKISQAIKSVMEKSGCEVELLPVMEASPDKLEPVETVVIGVAIRYGKHKKEVNDFVENNRQLLERKISAFFTVNVVARKPDKNTPETNPYLKKFIASVSWKPDLLGVFAGKIDYPKYGLLDRAVIRLIMFITKGPTSPDAVVEFTDWDRVESFGRMVADFNKTHKND